MYSSVSAARTSSTKQNESKAALCHIISNNPRGLNGRHVSTHVAAFSTPPRCPARCAGLSRPFRCARGHRRRRCRRHRCRPKPAWVPHPPKKPRIQCFLPLQDVPGSKQDTLLGDMRRERGQAREDTLRPINIAVSGNIRHTACERETQQVLLHASDNGLREPVHFILTLTFHSNFNTRGKSSVNSWPLEES